ncbi:hypothetical protein N7481_004897 [Penicillium waksmanii]|uniref:uncharacterized protein n=1 Tax=Penicillium waksmanii TaxID=69791 RepID=UPI002546D30C|nr:uncharacterized protein N7481_004897 [Penicillium waksmanii]KAJ5989687.1 hypothetical protein N7481_004897 [Penicillium waksmanii]
MLYETICKEEQDRRLNLGPRKFTTYILNYIEAAIRNAGDRYLPAPRKSLVCDAIFWYKQVGKKWSFENGHFTEMQMKALMFYVAATRPDIISLCSKLEYAIKYFLRYDQLSARPTLVEVREMIGIHNPMTVIVD